MASKLILGASSFKRKFSCKEHLLLSISSFYKSSTFLCTLQLLVFSWLYLLVGTSSRSFIKAVSFEATISFHFPSSWILVSYILSEPDCLYPMCRYCFSDAAKKIKKGQKLKKIKGYVNISFIQITLILTYN